MELKTILLIAMGCTVFALVYLIFARNSRGKLFSAILFFVASSATVVVVVQNPNLIDYSITDSAVLIFTVISGIATILIVILTVKRDLARNDTKKMAKDEIHSHHLHMAGDPTTNAPLPRPRPKPSNTDRKK